MDEQAGVDGEVSVDGRVVWMNGPGADGRAGVDGQVVHRVTEHGLRAHVPSRTKGPLV